jgi:hypothetical protein
MRHDTASFDPAAYTVDTIDMRTFKSILKFNNLRFTRFSVPHPCLMCDMGPINQMVYDRKKAESAAYVARGEAIPAQLWNETQKLKTELRMYRTHRRMLKVARAALTERKAKMVVGEVMVTRDFVNHHDHLGSHVKCLIWIVEWRTEKDGPLKMLKLRHYCSDNESMSTDA